MEFPDTPNLTPLTPSTWMEMLLPPPSTAHSWSVYADASWRLITTLQAQAVFGLQGSHHGPSPRTFQTGAPISPRSASRFRPPCGRSAALLMLQNSSLFRPAFTYSPLGASAVRSIRTASARSRRSRAAGPQVRVSKKLGRHWSPPAEPTFQIRYHSSGLRDIRSVPNIPPRPGPASNGGSI